MKLHVMAVTGRFQYAWTLVRNIRTGYQRAQVCDDRDGPYSKLRWRK